MERFTKKFRFSLISLAASKKKVLGSCTHNFDATDLPDSQFERLYPKLFTGGLKVDLGPIVWHTASSKVRQPRFLTAQKGCFQVFFFRKKSFPGETVNFHLQHVIHILKAIVSAIILAINEVFLSILRGVKILLTHCNRIENKI